MNKPESFLNNEMHWVLWDFEIQTDHSILGQESGSNVNYIEKKMVSCGFCCSSGTLSVNARKRKDYLIHGSYQR